MNLANFLGFQDPTKSKAKKRKERTEDKVAQTEKALAKARAGRELANKAKTGASIDESALRLGKPTSLFTPLTSGLREVSNTLLDLLSPIGRCETRLPSGSCSFYRAKTLG